jgi:hypothetical protein
VSRVQRDGSLRPYPRFSRSEPLLFLPTSSSVVLMRLSGSHYFNQFIKIYFNSCMDRLCGLVVRVLGYISGGRGSIPGTARKK